MATQAQIDANRRNAQLSTGPNSPPGKCSSKSNSLKHGLSGEGVVVDAEHRAEAMRRKLRWSEEIRPASLTGLYALDRAVAMSLRIEQCENSLDALFVEQQAKARDDWEHSRKVEALAVAKGFSRNPADVAARLRETKQGVALMIERWGYLAKSLAMGLWDEADRSNALDLLGVDPDYRKPGQTPLDGPEGDDPSARIGGVIDAELARLRARLGAILEPADDLAREQAEASLAVFRSKPAALILRYEREATRRFHAAMKLAYAAPKDDGPPGVFDPGPYRGPEPEPDRPDEPEPTAAPRPPIHGPTRPAESRGPVDIGPSTRREPVRERGTFPSALAVHRHPSAMPRPNRRGRRAEAVRLRRTA